MPYTNFQAFRQNKRQIEKNLNRVFGTHGDSLEEKIAPHIQDAITQHDFILDLHSFASGKDAFAFCDFDNNDFLDAIIANLPIKYVMSGWTDLYEQISELDTIGFTKSQGKMGITIECGQHNDPSSLQVAYKSILSVLQSLNIIKVKTTLDQRSPQKWINVDKIIRKKNGDRFLKNWENFDQVTDATIFGIDEQWIALQAPYDGYIIMPNEEVEIGGEWCYFGKDSAQ